MTNGSRLTDKRMRRGDHLAKQGKNVWLKTYPDEGHGAGRTVGVVD